jgi:His-Xaa-Ser system protein HxsD
VTIALVVNFDDRVYSLDSIKKAAYRFIDKFSVDFNLAKQTICCTLNFSANITSEAASLILDNFKREVLDQDLRGRIAIETEGVRNLILAHAFSKTSLVTDV